MAKQSYPKVTTPRGVAIWPRLNTPDTKFKAEGRYEAKIAIDGDDAGLAKLRTQVEQMIDDHYEAVIADITEKLTKEGKKGLIKKATDAVTKVSPFKVEEDEQTGDETGRILIKAGMTASGVYKTGAKAGQQWRRQPNIFNGAGVLIKNPPAIGGGSILKLFVELFPYFAANDKTVGVSFRLEAVQVIKLVSFGARDAASCGFGAEDDGDEFGDAAAEFGDETGTGTSGEDDEL